jgi:peptidoglycan/xylan/chitin deacetylase (PgdA/CDA1 family)
MSAIREHLLNLYYDATWPVRAWNRRRWAAKGSLPAIVFFWHRIADDQATPWTTSTAIFTRQIQWLQERFPLVSLAEAQQRILRGNNREPCVSITFDDGYADNCRDAIPLLIEKRIPCTYFVTAQNILQGEPFSHDLKMGYRFAPNSVEQLAAMAAGGIEIGAHAFTHVNLAPITDPLALYREVVVVKEELQKVLGRPIRYFAFPYGLRDNLNPAVFALAEKAGYAGVCSAYGGFNFPGDDPFHLQRISAGNSLIRMKNWGLQLGDRKSGSKDDECQQSPSTTASKLAQCVIDVPLSTSSMPCPESVTTDS